jgi:hypothetical protein
MGNKDHHSTGSSIVGVFSFLPSTKVVEEEGCQCSLFSSTHLCKLVAISGWWEEIFHHYSSFGCDCLKLVGSLLLLLLQLGRNLFVVVVASLRTLLLSSSSLSFVSDGLISTLSVHISLCLCPSLSLSLTLSGFFFCERLEEKVGEEKGFCHFFLVVCLFLV